MSEKKYVGSAFKGHFEQSQNIEISVNQLAEGLGIEPKKLKAVFLELYNKDTDSFTSPALYIKKFTTKAGQEIKELTIKLQSNLIQDGSRFAVTLNEFVPDATKANTANPKDEPEVPEAEILPEEDDDLPF